MTSLPPEAELPLRVYSLEGSSHTGSVHSLGVSAVVAFLFIRFSRVTDDWSAVLPGFNVGSLGLGLITSTVALIVALGTGGVRRAFASRAGFWLSAFTGWLVIAAPFSYWRRGSQMLLTDDWSRAFLVFVIVAGLLRTVRECRQAMYAIGCGSALIAFMFLRMGSNASPGRLVFGVSDYLSNPNDLAQLLLLGLPFVGLMVAETRGWPLRRLLAAITFVAILYAAAHTGSRGMLLGLIGMALVGIWKMSPARRIQFGLAGLVMMVWVFGSLPAALKQRYATVILSDSVDSMDSMAQSAASSREVRLSLLRESLSFTMRNPFVGVGPGVFEAVAAAEARRRGVREEWLLTHNTYTQVSSEAGLPALLFFVATLAHCLRTVSALHRRAQAGLDLEGAAAPAYCLLLSLVSFVITAFFLSVAYKAFLPALAGLSTALDKAVESPPISQPETDGRHAART